MTETNGKDHRTHTEVNGVRTDDHLMEPVAGVTMRTDKLQCDVFPIETSPEGLVFDVVQSA